MRPFRFAVALAVLLAVSLIVANLLQSALPVPVGFATKLACSAHFMQNRSLGHIRDAEQRGKHFLVDMTEVERVDGDRAVLGTLKVGPWAVLSRIAVYHKGLGCTLLANGAGAHVFADEALEAVKEREARNLKHVPLERRADLSEKAMHALNRAIDIAFEEPGKCGPALEAGTRDTRAVVVAHRGKVIAERYAPGWKADTMYLGWSMTKSVLSAAIGVAVKEGLIKLDDPLPLSAWKDRSDVAGITWRVALQMCSGMNMADSYMNPFSAVNAMLWTSADMAAYAAQQPMSHAPGTHWAYSSGTTNLLSAALREVLGASRYHRFIHDSLLIPSGITSAVIESDMSGTMIMSSFMYATAHDWVRFGQLLLNEGVGPDGKEIVPKSYVRFATRDMCTSTPYGAQIWLNGKEDTPASALRWASLPHDAYAAIGHEGQLLMVLPSHNLVIFRSGLSRPQSCFSEDDLARATADIVTRFKL